MLREFGIFKVYHSNIIVNVFSSSNIVVNACHCVIKQLQEHLTLILPRRRGYRFLRDFYLSSQNQKESDISNLGILKYILCGHFDEKRSGYGGGGKPSNMVGKDGCHLRKLKVAILKKKILIVWS